MWGCHAWVMSSQQLSEAARQSVPPVSNAVGPTSLPAQTLPASKRKADPKSDLKTVRKAGLGAAVTRRRALRLGGSGLAVAAAAVVGISGGVSPVASASTKKSAKAKVPAKAKTPTSTSTSKPTSPKTTTVGALGGLLPQNGCVLTPQMTEGPFYLDINKVRADITEGRPGTPLALSLTVVNASTCKPIADAAVDIWHTDALGTYSGVQGNSGIYMRGTLRSDANGVVDFKTVYPGWYNGRTVHIHTMVHVGGNAVHTGQLFFDDAVTDEAYKASPYNKRGSRDQRNANDGIYQGGGQASTLKPTKSGNGYSATMTMGVQA
jgi:protocatechuate 3,4-dioxygenase beta subunit